MKKDTHKDNETDSSKSKELEKYISEITNHIVENLKDLDRFIKTVDNDEPLRMLLGSVVYEDLFNLHTLIFRLEKAYKEMQTFVKCPIVPTLDVVYCRFYYQDVVRRIKETVSGYIKDYRDCFIDDVVLDENKWSKYLRTDLLMPSNNLADEPSDADEYSSLIFNIVNENANINNTLEEAKKIIGRFYDCDYMKLATLPSEDVDNMLEPLYEYVMNMARSIEANVCKELKQMACKMKEKRSEKLDEKHWGKLLDFEDEMMRNALKEDDGSSEDDNYTDKNRFLWITISEMRENQVLIKEMLDFPEYELIDIDKLEYIMFLLYSGNIELFVKLMLMGNIIRSKMDEKLDNEYEIWIGRRKRELEKKTETLNNEKRIVKYYRLSDDDKRELLEIIEYMKKCPWQEPATVENIVKWINVLYGEQRSLLEKDDYEQSQRFRSFFRNGRGGDTGRLKISVANIIGYLKRYRYVAGKALYISKMTFGNNDQVNNINKGYSNEGNKRFLELIPFMDKYRKIIIK